MSSWWSLETRIGNFIMLINASQRQQMFSRQQESRAASRSFSIIFDGGLPAFALLYLLDETTKY